MKIIKIVLHHMTDDPSCECDYHAVHVELDGEMLDRWGNHYDDKGKESAAGYVSGFLAALKKLGRPTPKVINERAADFCPTCCSFKDCTCKRKRNTRNKEK
jgi:hypothetical protein